jgi:hypothetical protein
MIPGRRRRNARKHAEEEARRLLDAGTTMTEGLISALVQTFDGEDCRNLSFTGAEVAEAVRKLGEGWPDQVRAALEEAIVASRESSP